MKRWKRVPFRGLSIQQRLPLLICVLLLAVMITFTWASYISVKKAALKAGRERLHSLTEQLSSVLSQSAQGFIAASRTAAEQPSIKKCLTMLDAGMCLEAQEILDKFRQDTVSIVTYLLDTKRRHVLRSGKDFIENKVNFDSLLTVAMPTDTGSFGRIYKVRDSMYYPLIVSVTDNQQAVIGYLVRWRMIASNRKSIEQFSRLLGAKATLYIGNTDGSLWTDMIKPIENPLPENVRPTTEVAEYMHGRGNSVMAAESPIKNTQWSILVEFSQRTVLESANTFLTRIIILGTILMIIGIAVVWIMSRNITRPLNKLTGAVSTIASGNDFPVVEVDRRDEVGKLARAFNAMSIQVQNAKKALELKVEEAEKMSDQLRDLSAHLQNIREQERIHIAREMHDELGQILTGFKMDVSWLNKKLSHTTEDPAIKEKLSSLLTLTDEAVSFVRKIAAELRPSVLDDLGLVAALEWQSKEFQKRFNIEVSFNSKTEDIHTSELIATGLFRMYQESLTNVARHSGAQKVVSNLQNTPRQICLSITDDGRGFTLNGNGERKTLGLLGMKERAVMIGGNLEILSEPGRGTTVIITVPLN